MENTYKIAFLGESTVGKTSLVQRMKTGTFRSNPDSTIGVSFSSICYKDIRLNLWDTAGQERYASMCQLYYRDADIIIIVFNLSNLVTLDKAKKLIGEARQNSKDNTQIIVIGNKSDLVDNIDDINIDIEYIRVSAKSNEGITELLEYIYDKTKLINKQLIVSDDIILEEQNKHSKCYC